MSSTPNPSNQHEQVKAPWVPLAIASKWVSALLVASLLLTVVTIIQAISLTAALQRKPWIVGYKDGKYTELSPENYRVSRDGVEMFLSYVIPSLYGSIKGDAPNLPLLNGLVNPNVIQEQKTEIANSAEQMQRDGVSWLAIVTGLNPETLVINRAQKFVYAEALGTVIMSKPDKATPTDLQWRCLLYIVEPLSYLKTKTPQQQIAGNEWGLYLQQIVEQPPGTINEDSPKPTTSDEQEKQEQELLKTQRKTLPSLNK
jgi:hypothetical protein